MTGLLPEDQAQREQALDISRSCCVQAPAGSGKTELLTQRILKLLAVCDKPEEILAITFTRKAAAEMRNRLLDNLAEAQRLSLAEIREEKAHKVNTLLLARDVLARDQALEWSLLENTGRLRINTIDSFNQFLVSQLPVTSALGMLPAITEKPREIYREAIRETMLELERDSPQARALETLLLHMNNQWATLENLFCNLLARRDQWLTYILDIRADSRTTREHMEHALVEIVETTLSELAAALAPYQDRLLPLLRYALENLGTDGESRLTADVLESGLPATDTTHLAQWQAISDLMITAGNDPSFRKRLDSRQGFPAQTAPGSKEEKALRKQNKDAMQSLLNEMATQADLLPRFDAFLHLPAPVFNDDQWRVLESLTTLLPHLVSHLSLAFARHQVADYPHINASALEALGNEDAPTDLALRMDYQLRHILVDEFQDTSMMQIVLLKKLTQGWQPGDGRTLFIVGDGMQSCYGFRNARVGLFLNARDNGIGSIRFDDLRLTCNFRSEEAVVHWVNDVFAGAFPREDDISRGGVRYNPATPVIDNTPVSGVSVTLVTSDKDLALGKERRRHLEAHTVAGTIAGIQRDHPGDSIALLVRSRTQLQELIPALRAQGLSWNATEIDPLISYPVIRDLLSLTRALLNPADNIAWYALLRSPMAGLALADLHRLAREADARACSLWQCLREYRDIRGLTGDALSILDRVVPVLALARQERQRLPLRDQVENTWILLGGHLGADISGQAENLTRYFALLEEHDSGGDIMDIHLFESEVGALYGSGQHPDASLQIMTIHKAKGLEFHHVIVPGLDRSTGINENPLLNWKEHITAHGEERVIMSLPQQKGRDREQDSIYRYLKFELELEQRMETTRLLYIAVTRAIRQAVLLGGLETDADAYRTPGKNTLLAAIWPQLQGRLEAGEVTLLNADESSPLPPAQQPQVAPREILSLRLPPAWRTPLTVQAAAPPERDSALEERLAAHHNLLQKQVGDIIHYCLMAFAEGWLDPDDRASLQAQESTWRNMVAPYTDDVDAVLQEIHRQIARCAKHERFAWMIRDKHEEAGSEVPLTDYSRDYRQDYVIDRTFVDRDGVRWIIDYKSSRQPGDMTRDAFVNELEERYAGQLLRYAQLYRDMESRPVRTALFLTAIPHFHEISPENTGPGSQ